MKKNIMFCFVLAALFLVIPTGVSAATVYVEASQDTVSVGDTIIITVKINADGGVLNTVDGMISLQPATGVLAIREFSLAQSSFGLWPRTPSLSKDAQHISFVGGVPGGFSIEGATVFKIIAEATKEGVVTVIPENIQTFASDGKGTLVPSSVRGLTLEVVPKKDTGVSDEWGTLLSRDTTPPEDFIVVLGQDQSLFEGKKFAFFSALDNQTGIDHYEVSENGAPAVRSGSTYVLQSQNDDVRLSVVAYDKSGNTKTALYPIETRNGFPWISVVIGIIVLFILREIYTMWRRARKNVSNVV
ncbi:hypothetical protein IPJ70_04150 [Candidatus Campbellbacteria bacterium]|nr:MAG: hypothetical protein IPJ70_04150 [Candidatus Campbellbacteria bacterium]